MDRPRRAPPASRFASIRPCATTRVSVFASSRASPIDQARGITSSEQGHRSQRPHPPGERAERRDEQEHVAVEVGVQGQQRREVREDEYGEDLVGVGPLDRREDQAEQGDEQRRPILPEAVDERDRRRPVVLETEPAAAPELLHAADVSKGGGQVDDEERARHGECDGRERAEIASRRHWPQLATTSGTRRMSGVLEAGGYPDGDPAAGRRA